MALSAWFVVAAWLEAKGPDAEGWTAGIAARAASLIVGYVGAMAALSLAAASKATEVEASIREMAAARGFSAREFRSSEVFASIRVVGEVVALPAAIVAVVCALLSHEQSPAALLPMGGAAAFAAVAAIVVGSLASACRAWGGAHPRRFLVAVVVLPWIIGNALLDGRGGEYLSVPGLLTWSWRLLTGAQG